MTAVLTTVDEIVPSKREANYNRFLCHHANYERFRYLSIKLETMGAPELAQLAARWSREHATVAAELKKRCR